MDPDPFGYGDLADPDSLVGVYGMGSRPGGWSFGSPSAWSPFTGQPGGYGAGSAANPIDPSAGLPTAGLFGNLSDILPQGADPSWGLLSAPAGGVAGSSPAVPDHGGLFSWTPGGGDPSAPTAVGAAGLNASSMAAPIAYGDPDQDAIQAPSSAAANDLDSAPDDVTTPQAVGRELPTDAPLLPAPAIPAWTTTTGHRAHHQEFQPGGLRLAFPAGSPGGAARSGSFGGRQGPAPRPAAHQLPLQGPMARSPAAVGVGPAAPPWWEDAIRSLPGAGLHAVTGVLGLSGDMMDLGDQVGGMAVNGLRKLRGLDSLPIDPRHTDARTLFGVETPDTESLNQGAEHLFGPIYKPRGPAGRTVDTFAQFAPAAVLGPEALGDRAWSVTIPAATSSLSGEAAHAYAPGWEGVARALGGLAGGAGYAEWRGFSGAPAPGAGGPLIRTPQALQGTEPGYDPLAPLTPAQPNATAAPGAAETAPTEVPQIVLNKAAGDAHEADVLNNVLPQKQTDIQPQITIRSKGPSGRKVRLDALGKDLTTDGIVLTDAKASPTAPFTSNQTLVYPELQTHGGVVVGKGKVPYVSGVHIPPTKVQIIRKTNP